MYYRLYGVGAKYFEKKLKEQGNACAICGEQFPENPYDPKVPQGQKPVLDHDHTTNLPRGVLCHACNTALGIVETKGNDWLIKTIRYKQKYDNTDEYWDYTMTIDAGNHS